MMEEGVHLARAHVFLKVEVEVGDGEDAEKIAEEIGRQLRKLYVVRSAEVSNVVTQPE
jgi:hypothetical protein